MADENVTNSTNAGSVNFEANINYKTNGADNVIKKNQEVSDSLKDVAKSAEEAQEVTKTVMQRSQKQAEDLHGALVKLIPDLNAKLSELGHKFTTELNSTNISNLEGLLKSKYGSTGIEHFVRNADKIKDMIPAPSMIVDTAEDGAKFFEQRYKTAWQTIDAGYQALLREMAHGNNMYNPDLPAGTLRMTDEEIQEQKDRIKASQQSLGQQLQEEARASVEDVKEEYVDAGEMARGSFDKGFFSGGGGSDNWDKWLSLTDGFQRAVDASMRNVDEVIDKNLGNLSERGYDRYQLKLTQFGENLVDTSKLGDVGAKLEFEFGRIRESIVDDADLLSSNLTDMFNRIPASVMHTSNGNIVNAVAMDAKAAGAEIQGLINELRELPTSLSQSKEYTDLVKQAEKYKQAWETARQKRDDFVMNTNDTSLRTYNNLQKQIEEYQAVANAAAQARAHLKKMGEDEKSEAMVHYNKEVDKAMRKVNTLTRQQQNLLNNRSIGAYKNTYQTYSTKMVEENVKLLDVMRQIDELQSKDNLSNSTDIMTRQRELVDQINAGFQTLEQKVRNANTETIKLKGSAEQLTKRYQGLKPPKGMVKTDEFKNLEKQYRSAYKALQTLSDKQEKYLQNGTKVDSKAWKNLQLDIEQARQKLEEYDALLTKAQSEGEAFTTKKNFIDLRWSDVFGSGWGKAFGDALSSGLSSFKKTTSVTFGALKKMLLGIWSLVPKIGKGIKDWAKNQKSLGDSAKQMYKTFTGYLSMLRTRIRRKFISMVFEDLQANIKALAKMSPRLNKVISDFIVSTKTLGAQIVAAFEPLVAKVLPYITMFVDYLTYAAQQMSQFISQLFGDDTWIKAVKGQYNFADSVDNTTSSTKKATKAAKEYENTVLSFDELHKLNGNDSGSEEDADGLTGVDLKYAELEANKLMEIAKKIHDAISAGDFYGAGKAMGEGVNEAFAWLRDTAGWSKNAEKFTKWAENAINLVNGLIDGIDGLANGQAIGDVINSVINIADKLVDPTTGIHFYEAGKTLGETFVSALLEIDWDTAGRALMNGLQGIAKGVTGFLTAEVYTMKNKTTGETRYARKDETGRPVWNDGTVVDPNEWNIEEDAMTGAQALGRGLHKMFSEAVKTFNVDTWSDLVASLVNEFFTFIGELFSEPEKAAEFGRKVGQLINETFEKINAEDVAGGINNFVASLTAFFESAFDETDWGSIFSKFKEIGELVDWAPIGKIIGVAMAPGLVTGLFSAVGSIVKTLGTAWIVSKILGIGGSGAAGGAAAGGAGLLGWLGAGAKTVGSILLGSYAGVGWSEFLGHVTNGKLGISEEHANKFYEDPFGGIGKTIQADLLGLKQMVGDIAGNVFGAEWGKDWYNSASQGLQAISDKVNGVQESVDAMNSDEFNTMWSQMKDEMYGDDAKLMNMDGQTFLDNATTSIPSLTLPADGSVLSSAPTEDFRNGLAEEVGAAFLDALTKTAGDVVMVVNGNEIGRVAMNYMAKYNKQYLATKPAVV